MTNKLDSSANKLDELLAAGWESVESVLSLSTYSYMQKPPDRAKYTLEEAYQKEFGDVATD